MTDWEPGMEEELDRRVRSRLAVLSPAADPAGVADRVRARARRRVQLRRVRVAALAGAMAVAGTAAGLVVSSGQSHPQRLSVVGVAPATPHSWARLPAAPISPRDAGGVWTGREMIVWGGQGPGPGPLGSVLDDGAAYNPVTHRWRLIAHAPLVARSGAHEIWTGTEMLVWGGTGHGPGGLVGLNDGAVYDPITDRWHRMARSPLPVGGGQLAAWTGRELLLWGGESPPYGPETTTITDGAAYNPLTNRWRHISAAPPGVAGGTGFNPQLAVWTGTDLIVPTTTSLPGTGGCAPGGGCSGPSPGVTFVAYNPVSDHWRVLPLPPLYVQAMEGAAAVWERGQLLLVDWNGSVVVGNPYTDRWHLLSASGPTFHRQPVLVRAGDEILAQGGGNRDAPALIEAVFDTRTAQWRALPSPPLASRVDALELDGDGYLVIWGGVDVQSEGVSGYYNDGALIADAALPLATGPSTTVTLSAPSTTTAAVSTCQISQLTANASPGSGAGGHLAIVVVFTNSSSSSCTIDGYPTAWFVGADGSQLGSRSVDERGGPSWGAVSLSPGDHASTTVWYDSPAVPYPGCPTTTAGGIRVFPPGQSASLIVTMPINICSRPYPTVGTTPMAPGSTETIF